MADSLPSFVVTARADHETSLANGEKRANLASQFDNLIASNLLLNSSIKRLVFVSWASVVVNGAVAAALLGYLTRR